MEISVYYFYSVFGIGVCAVGLVIGYDQRGLVSRNDSHKYVYRRVYYVCVDVFGITRRSPCLSTLKVTMTSVVLTYCVYRVAVIIVWVGPD